MRELNFSIPSANKASVGITTALYDRRALDCTSTLPLINSLNNLAYLTTSSGRIRDILTVDGGIERLVCILKEGRSKDMMEQWKWNLAFQCIVNIGVRGSEQVRTRVVEADMVPVIATILDNYFAVAEKCETLRQQESRRNRCPFGSSSGSKGFSRSSSSRTNPLDERSARARRQAPPPIAIPDPLNDPEAGEDEPLSEITPTGPTASLSLSSPPERTTFSRLHLHRHHRDLPATPSLGSSRQISDPPLSAVPLHNNASGSSFRPVRDIDRLPSMVPTLHAELSSQPQSPTTPVARPGSPSSSTGLLRPRRRPSIRHQLSISGSEDDEVTRQSQGEESPSEESGQDGLLVAQEPVAISVATDIVMQDILGSEEGLQLEPPNPEDVDVDGDARVTLAGVGHVPDVSTSTEEDETFHLTHRRSTLVDGDAGSTMVNPLATPTQVGGVGQGGMGMQIPPPINAVNASPPDMSRQTPAWYSSRLNLDRAMAPASILAAMPREEDVLMSLQLLAYVSKYCNLRSYFQKSHLVPRLRIGEDLRMLDPDYDALTDGKGVGVRTQEDEDEEWDNEFVPKSETSKTDGECEGGQGDFNIFPLIEKYTNKSSSSPHNKNGGSNPLALTLGSSSSLGAGGQAGDMQYWAGVVMRNLCRKDDSRGGIRQLWEVGAVYQAIC
ncbi:hypothetical protein LTR97_006334 [Elasticomyces elasticus]|uniref:Uncharacterized protein n=1 Tax=Elasticomyces elasticus TaxID=574655 RepID=A0AAN7VRT2_9PEZI|nr:hypothetical protein LTR97_006334 [Elasticomyces elasticus]